MEADPGIIEVPLEMNNFTEEVNSFSLEFYLDTLNINFIEVTDIVGFSSGNITANQEGNYLYINWFNINGYQPEGFVFNIKFDLSSNTNTYIDFVEESCEITYDLEPVPNIEYNNSFINTTDELPEPTLILSSFDTLPGQVSIPVEMLFFNSLISEFHLLIEIENESLDFIEISNLAYPLSIEDFEITQNENFITISWEADQDGFFPQNKIFDLNFNYLGGFDSQLNWDEDGSQLIWNEEPVENIIFVDGNIGQSFTSNQISLDNATVQPQTEFSLPLNFDGAEYEFTNEFSFILDYNSEQLDFMGITSQIVDITVTENENELILSWSGEPQDFTQASVAELQFYYDSEDNTTISFEPGSFVQSEDISYVPTNYSNGGISAIIPQDTIEIVSDSMYNNQNVTLPLTTTAIESVNELQFVISLTSNIELTNWAPMQLDGWELTENESEDQLTFSYSDESPIDVESGNLLLFEFYFSEGNSASLNFSDESFIIENDNEAVVSYIDGSISKASNNAQAVIENVSECENDLAHVPVNLFNAGSFKEILLRINFNDDAVQFSQEINVNDQLEGYSIEQGDGHVIFQWNADQEIELEGQLFELEFETSGTYSPISFGEGSQFYEEGGSSIPVDLINGEIDCDQFFTTLITNINGEGNVIVSSDGFVIEPDEGTTNQYTVDQGADLSLEAISFDGYSFLYWLVGNDTIYDNPYELTLNENLQVTATFTPNEYQLGVVDNPENGGNSFGEGSYYFDEQVTVEAYPFSGWSFNNWTNSDDQIVSENASYSFQMPSMDYVLIANYVLNSYSIELTANPSEGGVVLGQGNYLYNEEVTIEAVPNNDFSFINWTTETGIVVSNQPVHAFTMPYNNLLYVANFETDVSAGQMEQQLDVEIYPNPSHDILFIRYDHIDEINKITILNMRGKPVDFYSNKNETLIKIDVSGLSKGLYIVKIENERQAIFRKIIIN
jgi:hypothetical protein